jgi:hypothetical protein
MKEKKKGYYCYLCCCAEEGRTEAVQQTKRNVTSDGWTDETQRKEPAIY